MSDLYHRFDDRLTAPPLNEWDELAGRPQLHIIHSTFPVLSHTPKGVWLGLPGGDRRWVRSDARKRFAYPTVELARESFIARKRRQAGIYETRASYAREAITKIAISTLGIPLPTTGPEPIHNSSSFAWKPSEEAVKDIEEIERNQAVLGKPPRPELACRRCNATGLIPVGEYEPDVDLRDRWREAERRQRSEDGWHRVVCPSCGGSRSKFGERAAGMNYDPHRSIR